MDITWIIVIAVISLAGVIGTAISLLRERAPRVVPDPELVARMRDRLADREARLLAEQRAERVVAELQARGRAPQRSQPRSPHAVSTERLWAGGL
ncbi:hypothetical protein [Agrococcus sp. ProA11]|uniref:hypothetical protein n=1 Tax=Agrococcus chionoecetis TaxID=3153752 RepID=UPI0032609A13